MQDLASKTAKYPETTKKTCISASLLELIPGFEPGTSSLPTPKKGGCESVSAILFYVC